MIYPIYTLEETIKSLNDQINNINISRYNSLVMQRDEHIEALEILKAKNNQHT